MEAFDIVNNDNLIEIFRQTKIDEKILRLLKIYTLSDNENRNE